MGQLFGTDGVRGAAGLDLTAGLAMDIAAAAASVLTESGAAVNRPVVGGAAAGAAGSSQGSGQRPLAVVGRDPRASGEFLEAAVVAGLASGGIDVVRLGVIPTPGVAYLTAAMGAEFGVVLSASHNPAPDNGIKFFARGGVKLPDAVEDAIEARLAGLRGRGLPGHGTQNRGAASHVLPGDGNHRRGPSGVPAGGFGRVTDAPDQGERYLAHLLSTVQGRPGYAASPLAGLRVVVDCAHGAASRYAPELLRRAGADVIAIGADPDGLNINSGCGSTSLSALSAAVLEAGADAGIAHDGDADRCLAVDASGQVVDGDQILAVLAVALKAEDRLASKTVVATVMSNLGFRHAMRSAGIEVVETPVGDRYLIAAMLEGKFVLGGEQSGHIIMLDHATTGDGMLTGLHLLAETARQGRPLAELASIMTRYPQVLINVPGVDKKRVASSPVLTDAVTAAEAELGDAGRVLVRPSGTEPAVRVMVEAEDAGQADQLARRLADAIRELG
ncbi:MAG TPA: phosphoglucosamine mutase [Streptosporangiaceae bacterium]|jgi:phosphoglucosamine mutase|nr:phosphoglucosamine mutase [Streptosporangiaceae bacterium]